ncbi:SGNH/GDSL hydrolase family protein [Rhodoblastus sp.]|uniref:SGNH/GDSL hydrolase family protein n=1 Tax=Rhodoblastus sp. TaxID=1962975 RepID=UPI002620DB0E|nr:SGNH/GDSL hydrolase family protein [Rhodoblastus sp.]
MKSWIKNAILLVVAWAMALGGIELALRLFGDNVLALGNQFVFYRFDPKLGWSNNPNSHGYLTRSEYSIPVDINSVGMRDREPPPRVEARKRIAVLGDSFVWGVGARYGERFTEVLQRKLPQFDVLNYGVSGFGTTQELEQLDGVLDAKPDYVIVALCLSNDVTDSISPFGQGYNRPFARRGQDGKVEITGYPLVNVRAIGVKLIGADSGIRLLALVNMAREAMAGPNPALNAPRFKTDLYVADFELYTPDDKLAPEARERKRKALDIEADLLAEINAEVTSRLGAGHFLVALVPTKWEVMPQLLPTNARSNENGDQLLARLRARGVETLDPRGKFTAEDFWRTDGHWNPEGHVVFADALAERLAAQPVLRP